MSISNKIKKEVLRIIFEEMEEDECIVFLFGTQAEGSAVRSSDIDIGIICNNSIPAHSFVEIEEKLNNSLSTLKKIDFVDFSTVDQKVKDEALKEIEIWYTGKNCHGLLKSLKQA